MEVFKLILSYISSHLKTELEYKFAFISNLFIVIIDYGGELLGILFLLNKFHSIAGWNAYEIMFLYAFNLLSYGISGFILRNPFRALEGMIQRGDFDSILIRPINSFFHLICRQFQYLFFGHVILCIIIFWVSLGKLNISWTIEKSFYFILALGGSVLIQGALMIIGGSISFWVVKSQGINDVFVHGMRDFANYPILIYNKWIQLLLTFVLPYAFVNFYPAHYLLNKQDGTLFYPILQYCTPLVGVIMFGIAIIIFRIGTNQYQSTGS